MRQVMETLEKLNYLHNYGLNLFASDTFGEIDNRTDWVDKETLNRAYKIRAKVGRKKFAEYVTSLEKAKWFEDEVKLEYERGKHPIIYTRCVGDSEWGRTSPLMAMAYLILAEQMGEQSIYELERLARNWGYLE